MALTRPELDWRWHLGRQLDELGPLARRWSALRPDGEALLPGGRALEADFLRASIARARPMDSTPADEWVDGDPRIGVSRMSRPFFASLTCIAFAGLANGVGIDLSPGRYSVGLVDGALKRVTIGDEYEGGEVLRCAERPTSWPVGGPVVATVGELREYVWTRLYARNLQLLVTKATELVKVPERLLWTNAAEWVAFVMELAIAFLGPDDAAPFVADCRAVLGADSLPGVPGANPLRERVRWLPSDEDEPPLGIQTRHLCCLIYQHSDRHGRLCTNCPLLPLPDRAALVRERHWSGLAGPDNPVERRCAEVGLARLRRARRLRDARTGSAETP
jgi:Ferric iron reductase FhuF-like transporter